ncbi:hypothetical protein [Herbiconiux ginsengi]|uniref:Copper(I)-binding protein n=1 Tax=Herbiconiux ginsengi TaxID=381665 RepID=A0A1H3U7L5_9MICO|nr:hypothetical protein [Herbiconiux ginsengi]SDZ57549.1 hypothetical protein SAMN05216554_0142 [Herbiconiux ginsengi]
MTDSAELNRRTVLAGAAWSVPVVALAVATPAAAASEDTVTVTFAATLIELHRSDTFAALVAITNQSDAALPPEILQVTLVDLPTDENEFTVEFPDSPTMSDDQNASLPVSNTDFTATAPSSGSMTITSENPIALAARQTVVFGIYLRRPAHNFTQAVYLIAGTFTFGAAIGGAVSGTTVELTDEPE